MLPVSVMLGYGCTCANGGICADPEECDYAGPDCSESKYCGRDLRACIMGGAYVILPLCMPINYPSYSSISIWSKTMHSSSSRQIKWWRDLTHTVTTME